MLAASNLLLVAIAVLIELYLNILLISVTADIDLLIDDLFLNLDSRASDVKGGCGFTYTFPRNWSPCNYYKTTRFGILGFIGIFGFWFWEFP